MKICLINNLYKPYAKGGAERIVELQAEGLAKAGHEVFIIATKPLFATSDIQHPTSDIQHPTSDIRHPTSNIYYLNGLYYNLNKIPKILRLPWHVIDMFDIGNYLKIKSILKKAKPDIVITHNLKGLSYLIPRVIKCLKIKHIHVLHDIQLIHPSGLIICEKEKIINSFSAKIYATVCRWLFGSPNIVISPSNWLMKLHERKNFFPKSKKIILPNPAPNFSISPLLTSLPAQAGREAGPACAGRGEVFRFLYVGQIEKHKGILFLIKVWQLLGEDVQKFPETKGELIIVGEGSKIKEAKKLAGNNKSIKFLGVKNKDGVTKLMSEANCLIVPSLGYENSPTVIYEAAAAGLPIIASRLGGIPELIHDLSGILFKSGNEGDLRRQMKWVASHPDELKEIGEKGREKIKKFQLKYYIKKLTALL